MGLTVLMYTGLQCCGAAPSDKVVIQRKKGLRCASAPSSSVESCRTVEVGRGLWRSSYPSPAPSTSRADCPGPCPNDLNISKGGCSAAAQGHLCWCSVTLAVRKCLLTFRQNLLHFNLCQLLLALLLDTTERSLAPSALHPPFTFLYTLVRPASAP